MMKSDDVIVFVFGHYRHARTAGWRDTSAHPFNHSLIAWIPGSHNQAIRGLRPKAVIVTDSVGSLSVDDYQAYREGVNYLLTSRAGEPPVFIRL